MFINCAKVNVEFTNYVTEVANELTTNIDVIIAFLSSQVEAYSTQNVSTEQDLSATSSIFSNLDV